GQQVDASVSKINVHDIRTTAFQQVGQELIFPAINDRRPTLHKLQPSVPNRIETRCGNELDIVERKTFGVLDFLRHDEGTHIAQTGYLPVDVKHLRFEESCAVTGDDQFRHKKWGTGS